MPDNSSGLNSASEELASANVSRFLALQAKSQPDTCALKAPTGHHANGDISYEEISFAALQAQSGKIAHGLNAKGIQPGSRVLLMVRPGSDLIRCCFALFMSGAVPVVIDPGMGLRHFLDCVRRTKPDALLGIPLAQLISRLFPGNFKTVKSRVTVGRNFSKWYDQFSDQEYIPVERKVDDLAAILFTSGSTGPPKGVCYGHGQFDAQVHLIRETFEIQPGEIDLPMLPVFALFNPALGMTTVVPEINPSKPATVKPQAILDSIKQNGVTNSFGAPILWDKIIGEAIDKGQTFPTVRRIMMAGAPVSPSLARRMQPVFPNATLWSPYGATECLPVSAVDGDTIVQVGEPRTITGHGTCVGKPVKGVSVRIIRIQNDVIGSIEDIDELPAGEIGEIVATGPSVTKSYDALPEATAKAKISGKSGVVWHRMGDAGYLDTDGRIWFCGRIAERVETREGILYTDRCEGIFNAHPTVRRSALIGLGKAPDQEPAIVIDPADGAAPEEEALLGLAREHQITASIKKVFITRDIPVDVRHNAKINRLKLARRFQGK